MGAHGKSIANRHCRGVVSCDESGASGRSVVSERCRSAKVPGSGGRVARAFWLGTACFCADGQSFSLTGADRRGQSELGDPLAQCELCDQVQLGASLPGDRFPGAVQVGFDPRGEQGGAKDAAGEAGGRTW